MSLGLDRISELLDALGNPQNNLRFVHVAGTNGKGSTSAFIAQILQEAGYKVGLFTSPYIIKFEERIQINRQTIPYNNLVEVTARVRDVAETMQEHPTEFELMTATAFLYFSEKKCDVVVTEVGLGGRLDSTNVITNVEVSVITPIAFDHCAVLGNTIAEIAQEKAGIIKKGVPVVSASQVKEAREVIERTAKEKGVSASFAEGAIEGDNACFSYGGFNNLNISLLGRYQRNNAVLALEAARCLQNKGWSISNDAIYKGLAHTAWPGRFEIIGREPLVIVDGSHNEQGVESLVETLSYRYKDYPIVFVVGILEDKAHRKMLERLVSLGSAFVAIPVNNPRAFPVRALAQEIEQVVAERLLTVNVYEAQTIEEGIAKAVALVPHDGVICACGSLYSIADIKRVVKNLTLK